MAKRRRKEEEEEEFTLPEFDKAKYLRKEVVGAKVMILTVVLALAAAALSYVLTRAGVVIVAFFAGLSLVFLLKHFVRLFGVDTSKMERKDWFGHGTTFFFAWLSVWILILNVPFADVTQPSLTVFVEGGEVTGPQVTVTKDIVNVTARATDNAGIKGVWIQVGNGALTPMDRTQDDRIWSYRVTGVVSNTSIIVTAEDVSGNPPVSVQFLLAR